MRPKSLIYVTPLLLLLPMVWRLFAPWDGLIGHDYYHAYPRFFFGALYFWKNGLSVPQFIPNLCGGIPYFADPQSYYYSLPQWLSFVWDPLFACQLTYLLFYTLGYWGWVTLGKELKLSKEASHLSALVFVTNGFVFANLFVGHVTHHQFLLAPWLLYFLSKDKKKPFLADAALFSLLWIYTLYSGGIHVFLVLLGAMALLFPFLVERHRPNGLRRLVGFLACSALAVLLAYFGKYWEGYLYSKNFYSRGLHLASEGLVTQVSRYFWFRPHNTPTQEMFGDMMFGAWEYIGFVSRFTLPALIFTAYRAAQRRDKKPPVWLFVTLALAIFLILVGAGKAGNAALPFFRTYHNPIKFFASLIPALCLVCAYSFHALFASSTVKQLVTRSQTLLFFLFVILILGEFSFNTGFFTKEKVGLSLGHRAEWFERIKERREFPRVEHIVDRAGVDLAAVVSGFSAKQCYEGVFGYRHELLKSTVTEGPTDKVVDGHFNLNHPGCLLFPEHYSCRPWDRIKQSDRENFEAFITGAAAFPIPAGQKSLLWLGLLTIVALAAVVLHNAWHRFKSPSN